MHGFVRKTLVFELLPIKNFPWNATDSFVFGISDGAFVAIHSDAERGI